MIIDLIVVLIFIYIGMIGFRRGAWLSCIHLCSTLFSLWVAQRLYMVISQRLELFVPFPKTRAYDLNYTLQFDNIQQRFDHIIAFLIIATVTKMICYGIIVIFDNIHKYQSLHLISRIIGVVMSVIASIIITSTLIYGVALYPLEIIQQQLSKSIVATYMVIHIPYVSTFVMNI
ncbi:CvpA family protein [Staphylococcus succinus]|uniref:CvpA family protein n=1 Tax=Staphylococcus succinus TaxID=61015 RepID=UPI000935BE59|nr:CvpA family protein [Staphylococcus succinus]